MIRIPSFSPWSERRLIVGATIVLLILAMIPSIRSRIEDLTFKVCVPFTKNIGNKPEVTLIELDDSAFEKFGPLPWPKGTFPKALERLRLLNARVIAYDASIVDMQGLAELRTPSKETAPLIIAGYTFYPTLADLPQGYNDAIADGKVLTSAADLALPSSPSDDSSLAAMAGIDIAAATGVQKRSARDGFSNLFPEGDGVVRRQPLAVRLKHRAYPSLALATAAAARGYTPLIAESPAGKPSGITLGDFTVNTDPDSSIAIQYLGPEGAFPRISFLDLLAGTGAPEEIADRVLLFGITAHDKAKTFETPFGRMTAVEITANAMNNILRSQSLKPLATAPWVAVAILAAMFMALISRVVISGWKRLLVLGIVMIGGWIATLFLARSTDIVIPTASFSLALVTSIGAILTWQLFGQALPKRSRARIWKMRVSSEELARAVSIPGSLDPRGHSVNLTAIAMDLRGFGTMAETIPIDRLCSLLRGTRTIIADTLIKNGGFVDSWAGDECRAAFGALAPRSDHALAACRAVSALLKAISQISNDILRKHGIDKLKLRFGIGSGNAAVGELGPKGADGYGVTGSAMEAACSLRALNRAYRTGILVEAAVHTAAEASFTFRPLDPVQLHTGAPAEIVYEMLGETGIILPQMPLYLEAREAYLRGDFQRAVHLFAQLLREFPNDGPSQIFMRRAKMLASSPPPKWTGVWA